MIFMIITENGLITENQDTLQEKTFIDTEETNITEIDSDNIDLTSNDNNLKYESILSNENVNTKKNDTLSSINIATSLDSSIEKNTEKESIETNCLALTVRKDYNFSIAKNTVFKTIRMSIKVAISTFVLNLIKLFF